MKAPEVNSCDVICGDVANGMVSLYGGDSLQLDTTTTTK